KNQKAKSETNPRSQTPDPQGEAEAETYFQKALEIARRQQAKSWELRAAISLSQLWRRQGKITEARNLLADIHGWFTEGFDTKDLREAETLLIALGGKIERKRNGKPEVEEDTQKMESNNTR